MAETTEEMRATMARQTREHRRRAIRGAIGCLVALALAAGIAWAAVWAMGSWR